MAAIQALERAVSLKHSDKLAHFELGNVYRSVGREEEAVREWRAADACQGLLQRVSGLTVQVEDREVEHRLGDAIACSPDSPDAYYALGDFYESHGETEHAMRAYRQGILRDQQTSSFRLSYYSGILYAADGKWDEAISAFQAAKQFDPKHPLPYQHLAWLLFWKKNDLQGAMSVIEQAIAVDSGNIWPYIHAGDFYLQRGDLAQASQWFASARDVAPESEYPLFWMGKLALQERNTSLATELFTAAVQRNPSFVEALSSLGDVYAEQANYPQAITYYQRAIQVASRAQRVDLHMRLALAYKRNGQVNDAIAEFRQVLVLDPENEGARNALAELTQP